ncbi:MAG TPA: PKD-like family lipoprotein, partial [Parasegetibacter sp.]
MKTLKFLYLPAICWIMIVLTGCYKDLGNYDYDPSFGDVQITFVPSSNFNAVAGQEFSMRATVVSKSTGDSTRFFNENDYEFEWYANGDILSTDKNYTGICMLPVGQAQGVYSVINKKTGERTMAKYVINVSSAINIGWMILADKGGKSDLTYIRWQNPTSGSVFTPFLNAYALFNQGAELGSQPIKMVEHYAYMTGESEVLVIQKGGQGPVELSGKTLAKVVTMKEEFLDGEFPEGFVAKDAFYFGISDFVLDETGRVFSKTSANPSDQSPLYMSHHRRYNTFPVTVEGGWKIKNFVGSDFQSGTLLFFDENRKGYFATVNS